MSESNLEQYRRITGEKPDKPRAQPRRDSHPEPTTKQPKPGKNGK